MAVQKGSYRFNNFELACVCRHCLFLGNHMSSHRDILLLLRFFLRDLQAATEGEGERESSRGSSKEEDSGSKVDLRLGTLRCSSARKLDSFAGRVARLPANPGNRR